MSDPIQSLDEIGVSEGCDKSSQLHDYLKIYSGFLDAHRNSELSFLEFGVFHGASMRMWRRYFKHAEIFGVDCNLDQIEGALTGVHLISGNVNEPSFWIEFPDKKFDVVVDDGDHHVESQWNTFLQMIPRLNSGGIYFIEDLHFSGKASAEIVIRISDIINEGWAGTSESCGFGISPIRSLSIFKSLLVVQMK